MAGKDDSTPHEIVHGTEGKPTLEHTQHEAPMPEIEKGDGIDLSSTSSKTHGSSGPTSHDKSSSSKSTSKNTTSHSGSTTPSTGTAGSHGTYASVVREGAHSDRHESLTSLSSEEKKKGGKGTLPPSISASEHEPSHSTGGGNKFDQIDRENAEKFGGVNLDNEGKKGPGQSSSSNGSSHEKKRGSGHDDDDHHDASQKKSSSSNSNSHTHEPNHSSGGNKFDQIDRENAEKFGGINLDNEGKQEQGQSHGSGSSHSGSHEKKSGSGSGHDQHDASAKKTSSFSSTSHAHEPSHNTSGEANKFDQMDRANAEKFGGVNLSNE